MLERRGCSLPTRLTHGPTILGILTATLTLLIHSQSSQAAQDRSYSGLESYAIYPGWAGLSLEKGLLQLTFRTSNGSGLLLYAEGNDGHEALAIMLEGGKISVMVKGYTEKIFVNISIFLPETEQFYLSENLNNNKPHTLSLQQTPAHFTVSVLNKSVSESSSLLSAVSSSIGSRKIYIGGLPSNVIPLFPINGHFRGCLGDIQFVDNSTDTSSLVSVLPFEQQGVVEGCSDPCANISCGGGAGTCVALLPDRYFCDCSSTPFGGANCKEDLSMHRLNLTVDSYLCYALDNFPIINRVGSVQLLAPLPLTGTIMTGVSHSGEQFYLYLEKSILKLELISSNGFGKLSTDQVLNRSTSYQVDFVVGADMVELSLATISGSVIKRLNKTLTFPIATFFTTVCVGGTMLEIPYYVGILERVIYNAVPLSDRSFVQHYAKVETLVNVISISDQFAGPPLIFERLNFANYHRITFEMRLKQDTVGLSGTPFASSGKFEIQFTTFNGQFTIFGSNGLVVLCPSTPPVDDNMWHRIDLILMRNGNGTANFTLTVDDISCDRLTDSQRAQFGELLASLTDLDAPLRFGVSKLAWDTVTVSARFIGCFRNIEFRETPNSEPIHPDLTSVTRSEQRFSKGEKDCYTCSQQDKLTTDC